MQRDHDSRISWPSLPLILGVFTFCVAIFARFVFNDPDTYWHLAAGEWMLSSGSVPSSDPFSHSMLGETWVAHEWGSEIILALVHKFGGWQALQLLIAIAFASSISLMARQLLSWVEPVQVVILVSFAIVMMSTHLLVRPHVLSWPILAFWFTSLTTSVEQRKPPSAVLLPLLLVWANLHASFTLGLAFLAAFGVDAVVREDGKSARLAAMRRWVVFGALAGAIVLINPRGWHALSHALDVMGMKVSLGLIAEWRSTNFHEPQVLMIWLATLLVFALSGNLRVPPVRSAMIIGLLYLALKHERYHSLLGLVSPFLIAPALGESLKRLSHRAEPGEGARIDQFFKVLSKRTSRPASLLMLAAVAGVALITAPKWRLEPAVSLTPADAIAQAEKASLSGNVFNAYSFGGYLIYRSIPVFVDGRADMYGDEFMARLAKAMRLEGKNSLEALLDSAQIEWTLLQPNTASVEMLDHLPEWERIYSDTVAVVHRRRVPPP